MCTVSAVGWGLYLSLAVVFVLNLVWCGFLYRRRDHPIIKALHWRFLLIMTSTMTLLLLVEAGRFSWQLCVMNAWETSLDPPPLDVILIDSFWLIGIGFLFNLMLSAHLGRVFQYVFIFYRTAVQADPGLRYFWGGIVGYMLFWTLTRFVYLLGRLGVWSEQWYTVLYSVHIGVYVVSAGISYGLAFYRVQTRYFDFMLQTLAAVIILSQSVLFTCLLVFFNNRPTERANLLVVSTLVINLTIYLCFALLPFARLRGSPHESMKGALQLNLPTSSSSSSGSSSGQVDKLFVHS
jgi:hypothetical protein